MRKSNLLRAIKLVLIGLLCCLDCLCIQDELRAQTTKPDLGSEKLSSQDQGEITAKLKSAVALGEIKVDLKPMIPTDTVRGIRWSPKGNKIALEETGGVLSGKLQIGKHEPLSLELNIDDLQNAGEAVLKLDLDRNGQFGDDEVEKIKASESRGKFWYSFKATINLPIDATSTRPYPICLWHVIDPNEDASENVIRWSRRGWHEGEFRLNERVCTAVITDANSDGMFTALDAWGLGESAKQAYAYENSTSKMNKHAWLDSVAYQITDSDEQGRFITVRAFDLGMTQAEDREQKDPYAPDRKYARGEKPVNFLKDYEEAIAIAKKEDKRIVVDFVTTWCGPCRVMDQLVYTAKPVVEKSSELVFLKLDGDEQKELNDKFEVKGYPTLILLDQDGNVIRKSVGYQSVKELLEFIE